MAAVTAPSVIVATAEPDDGDPQVSSTVADLVGRLIVGGETEPLVLLWHPSPLATELAGSVPVAGPPIEGDTRVAIGLRRMGLGRFASRLKDARVGFWLWRHRQTPIVLVGDRSALILPWLTRHRAPVVWLLVDEDGREHDGDGDGDGDQDGVPWVPGAPTVDPIDLALLDHVLVGSAALGDRVAATARRGGRTPPPMTVVGRYDPVLIEPPPAAALATVGLIGGLDDDHGVDLTPRLLWQLERSASRPVTAVWATWGSADLPASVRHDLRNLDITDRVQVQQLASPGDLRAWLDSVAMVVLPWREPLDPELLAAIARHGRPCAAFAPSDDVGPVACRVQFPLVEELAEGAARLLADDRARLVAATDRHPERVTRLLLGLLLGTGRPEGA